MQLRSRVPQGQERLMPPLDVGLEVPDSEKPFTRNKYAKTRKLHLEGKSSKKKKVSLDNHT